MKRRLLLIFLTLVLAIGTCVITGCGSSDEDGAQQEETTAQATEEQQDENAQSPEEIKTGMLSMLNITEEQFEPFLEARGIAFDQLVKDGYASSPLELSDNLNVESNVVFFDSLDAMLMSLNAGEIQTIDIYQSVAAYLCATNDNLVQLTEYDTTKDRDAFAKLVFDGCLANDFAFLLRESDEPLRDQFNDAIANMKADGTIQECFTRGLYLWGDNPCLRWAVNNTKRIRSGKKAGTDTGNYYYGKIEAKSRKTDPFMAHVAAMTAEELLGTGEPLKAPPIGAIRI